MAHLSLLLLGPFQVTLAEEPVTSFQSDKVRALSAYLAVEADRPHRRDSLAGLLWPDWSDRAARTNLRNALANLRTAIGDRRATPPFLLITRETIQFNTASDYWLDVAAFSTLVDAHQPTVRQLEEAIALYRGSFLEGFFLKDSPAFEDWSLIVRERLQRQALAVLHRLAGTYEQRGEYEQARGYAWRQVEIEPWQEQAHRQLMRLLALSGQRGAALAQYETCRHLLAEELGVEPAAETTALYEHIRDGTLGVPAPSPPRPPTPPHNLPASLTLFVGRETELAEIQDRLRDSACRLLTLVGPGGSGKTRLALEAAGEFISGDQVDRFSNGVYFVPLARLRSAQSVVPAVAQALNLPFYTDAGTTEEVEPQQQLLNYLQSKDMLIILDNFEHLLEGAGLVTDILKTAPEIKILATSQARLNLLGEHPFVVPGMDYPALTPGPVAERGEPRDIAQYSAIKLFLQGVRQVQPGFEPAADDLADIAHICHLVQGMPLGILLAAAWIEMLTPARIASEIEQSLDFLETGWRDAPERQRSLRAVFDHSWNLLIEREQEVFQGLSVFHGGFTRQAAEQVAGASLHELKALMDKSFLQLMPSGRYEMHELLRQYAAQKLQGSPGVRKAMHERHSAYYTDVLQQWQADQKGRQQPAPLASIEADSENVRAAWDWAVEYEQVERLDRAMEDLAWFYHDCGRYQEGEAAVRAAADQLAVPADLSSQASYHGVALAHRLRVLARALSWQSLFSRALGRRELATRLQRQSLALLERPELAHQDTRRERAALFRHMGYTVVMSDYERARQLFAQSLALYRELDDDWGTVLALSWLGTVARLQGAYGEARRLLEECLTISQALGDQRRIAWSMAKLAHVAARQGRLEKAEFLARKSRARSQKLGHREITAYGLHVLGEILESLARFAEARSVLEECLAISNELGRRGFAADAHAMLGSVSLHLGQYAQARAHAETGLALARATNRRVRIGHTLLLLGSAALAEEAYAEAQRLLQESVAVYRETEQPDDIARALALSAYAARGLGQRAQAQGHLSSVLRTVAEIRVPMPLLYGLPALALLLADQGEGERAVQLYTLASRYPIAAHSRWFEDVAGSHIATVAASLSPDAVKAAEERGPARDLETTVAELLVELEEMEGANDG